MSSLPANDDPRNALTDRLRASEQRRSRDSQSAQQRIGKSGPQWSQTASRVEGYRGKRAADLVILVVMGLPALVVGLLCALAVRLSSAGPVLFRQERIGHHGLTFTILKFRTMQQDAKERSAYPDAVLITGVGRVLRRFSLDELPQLLNVLKGDMSIVGPRPTMSYQVLRYSNEQKRRLNVRPGLTGLAQVRGRNDLLWTERIALDIEYVDHQSLKLDLSILCATLSTTLRGTGVDGQSREDPLDKPESQTTRRLDDRNSTLHSNRSASNDEPRN